MNKYATEYLFRETRGDDRLCIVHITLHKHRHRRQFLQFSDKRSETTKAANTHEARHKTAKITTSTATARKEANAEKQDEKKTHIRESSMLL